MIDRRSGKNIESSRGRDFMECKHILHTVFATTRYWQGVLFADTRRNRHRNSCKSFSHLKRTENESIKWWCVIQRFLPLSPAQGGSISVVNLFSELFWISYSIVEELRYLFYNSPSQKTTFTTESWFPTLNKQAWRNWNSDTRDSLHRWRLFSCIFLFVAKSRNRVSTFLVRLAKVVDKGTSKILINQL